MKRILVIIVFSTILWSCDSSVEDIIQDELEAVGEFTVTGAKATASTEEYPVEIFYLSQGSGETAITSLQVSIGNVGQTDDVVVINLNELGNGDGFQATTYNYTSDVNANLQLISYYADADDIWQILEDAASLTNKLTITSISENRVKGNFEFNFQKAFETDLIKITGSFEGPSSL